MPKNPLCTDVRSGRGGRKAWGGERVRDRKNPDRTPDANQFARASRFVLER